MSKYIFNITDDEFNKEVIQNDKVTLVDFWAPWCGPCKSMMPILDQISEHYQEKLKIVKINIDKNKNTATQFSVRGIPTLMVFKDGENIETKVGSIEKSKLIKILDKYI